MVQNLRSRQGGNFSYFIYGVVICAVVLGCMGLPAIAKNFRSDYDKLQTDYNVLQNNMKTELENKTATIDRLTQENEDTVLNFILLIIKTWAEGKVT